MKSLGSGSGLVHSCTVTVIFELINKSSKAEEMGKRLAVEACRCAFNTRCIIIIYNMIIQHPSVIPTFLPWTGEHRDPQKLPGQLAGILMQARDPISNKIEGEDGYQKLSCTVHVSASAHTIHMYTFVCLCVRACTHTCTCKHMHNFFKKKVCLYLAG